MLHPHRPFLFSISASLSTPIISAIHLAAWGQFPCVQETWAFNIVLLGSASWKRPHKISSCGVRNWKQFQHYQRSKKKVYTPEYVNYSAKKGNSYCSLHDLRSVFCHDRCRVQYMHMVNGYGNLEGHSVYITKVFKSYRIWLNTK